MVGGEGVDGGVFSVEFSYAVSCLFCGCYELDVEVELYGCRLFSFLVGECLSACRAVRL